MTADGIKLLKNQFAWSNVANMLYVSQPKGVGFSYCEDLSSPCVNDDVVAAQDAYDFFVNFFAGYPEFKQNDFYLTAESCVRCPAATSPPPLLSPAPVLPLPPPPPAARCHHPHSLPDPLQSFDPDPPGHVLRPNDCSPEDGPPRYGGIYIPMFMDQIDRRGGVNLKGAAIGDGCWGTSVGTCNFTTGKSMQISTEFFQGHGMFDQSLYEPPAASAYA